MANPIINAPETTEFATYYGGYVSLVPAGNFLETFPAQLSETLALLRSISETDAEFRYAPDKWTIKELVGHMIDAERVFAYRALCVARNDKTSLPGFDENEYARNASFNQRELADLTAELEVVRNSTLFLLRNLSEEEWQRRGTANNAEISVRALAYIIAGHEIHHRGILRERYLPAIKAGKTE